MRNILLLGASGFLGRELARRLRDGHRLTGTYHNHPDANGSIPFDIFQDSSGQIAGDDHDLVICCARLFDPQVDAGADKPKREQALLHNLRRWSQRRVVLISTDAVFSGRDGNYAESAAREPGTAYGQRMRWVEDRFAEEVRAHCIVRCSYLYGYSAGRLDKRLADSLQRLDSGASIEFFDDMYKSPMAVGQTADAVCKLALSDVSGAVHVAGPRMSVYEFQRQALAVLGADATRVRATAMPAGSTLPRDTSLDSGLMRRLTGVIPDDVTHSLAPRSP